MKMENRLEPISLLKWLAISGFPLQDMWTEVKSPKRYLMRMVGANPHSWLSLRCFRGMEGCRGSGSSTAISGRFGLELGCCEQKAVSYICKIDAAVVTGREKAGIGTA
jgi:hypothetical protein